MSWIILVIADLLEVVWAVGLKYIHDLSRLTPSVITVMAMIVSLTLFAWTIKPLPAGTVYVAWTDISTVDTAVTGIAPPGKSTNPTCPMDLALIVLRIIGLKLSTH